MHMPATLIAQTPVLQLMKPLQEKSGESDTYFFMSLTTLS